MRVVKVEEAVGKRLAHDYTCIEPGFKGAIKRRGDVVEETDVKLLKECGHYYVYVENGEVEDQLHEVEAVAQLGEAVAGDNVEVKVVDEGKAFLYSTTSGLLIVNSEGLKKINSTGFFVVVTRKTGSYVRKRDIVAVVDLIPLTVSKSFVEKLKEELSKFGPLIRVVEAKHPKVAILVTGTEIVEGLRKDLAVPIIVEKLKRYECTLGKVEYARDNLEEIARKIRELVADHNAVVVTGGMSVDPTDYTPKAIQRVADEVVAYGVPVKPNTMSMIAYKNGKPIIGVSAGIVHYSEENILDILLPWVSSGVKITRDFILSLGEGGLMKIFLEKIK